MVTVTNYKASQSAEGKDFFSLQVQGGIEPVQGKSGRYYLTTRSCWISTTFPEEMCRGLIGTSLPGKVAKVECEPFEYTVQETGEVLTLEYQWQYLPEEAPIIPAKDMIIPQHLVIG